MTASEFPPILVAVVWSTLQRSPSDSTPLAGAAPRVSAAAQEAEASGRARRSEIRETVDEVLESSVWLLREALRSCQDEG